MEFISRDEAIAMLEDMEGRRDEDGYIRVYKLDVIANLRSLSSIDIVRCEECVYNTDNTFCMWLGALRKPTDFCSYGKRRSQ